MTDERKELINDEAAAAFARAVDYGYVSEYSSADSVKDMAYEILEFMDEDELKVDELTDEEYEFAASVLLECLC